LEGNTGRAGGLRTARALSEMIDSQAGKQGKRGTSYKPMDGDENLGTTREREREEPHI